MLYFGYGMNTNISGMSSRCKDARLVGAACLRDFRLAFNHHADIEEHDGDDVWGVLWNISHDDLACLDRLEGYPTYYTREKLIVEYEGREHRAMVYIMNRRLDEYEEPGEWYWDCLMQGYKENDLPVQQLWGALDRCPRKDPWSRYSELHWR
jgi:gamma-glutamylcyclotransferase (GGCT)/AIG2-like uncharacterized protein YtfP